MQPNLSYASDNGDDEADEFSKCVLVLAEKVGVLTRRRESRLRLGTYEPRDKKQTVFPTLQALSGVFGTDQSTTLRLDLVVKDCIWLFEQEQALGFSSVSTNTSMTVIKLKSGRLWVHAPIAPTKECIRAV